MRMVDSVKIGYEVTGAKVINAQGDTQTDLQMKIELNFRGYASRDENDQWSCEVTIHRHRGKAVVTFRGLPISKGWFLNDLHETLVSFVHNFYFKDLSPKKVTWVEYDKATKQVVVLNYDYKITKDMYKYTEVRNTSHPTHIPEP